ncbi:hypothetical protein FHX45_001298 [Amycolatopsis granulosa]|nr:hypothetical protein [Amycolatopsis granulosa]
MSSVRAAMVAGGDEVPDGYRALARRGVWQVLGRR